jgi:hypothetical protein
MTRKARGSSTKSSNTCLDKQPEAIDKVIEQAELFADELAIDGE